MLSYSDLVIYILILTLMRNTDQPDYTKQQTILNPRLDLNTINKLTEE